MEKFSKFNKRRAFDKAVGPEKKNTENQAHIFSSDTCLKAKKLNQNKTCNRKVPSTMICK